MQALSKCVAIVGMMHLVVSLSSCLYYILFSGSSPVSGFLATSISVSRRTFLWRPCTTIKVDVGHGHGSDSIGTLTTKIAPPPPPPGGVATLFPCGLTIKGLLEEDFFYTRGSDGPDFNSRIPSSWDTRKRRNNGSEAFRSKVLIEPFWVMRP